MSGPSWPLSTLSGSKVGAIEPAATQSRPDQQQEPPLVASEPLWSLVAYASWSLGRSKGESPLMLACLAEVAPGIGAFPRGGRAVSRATIIPLDKQNTRAPPQTEAATFLSHKGYVLFQKSLYVRSFVAEQWVRCTGRKAA